MITGCLSQPIVDVLKNEPIVHPMVRTRQDVLLKLLPNFRNGLIRCLLEDRDPSAKSIGFARHEELHEECHGAIIPSVY